MSSPHPRQRDFSSYLENYLALPFEREMERYRSLRLRELVAELGGIDFLNVLDVGIGVSPVSRSLEGIPKTLTLVEPIQELLDIDRERHPLDAAERFVGTVENLPRALVPAGGFDLVLLSSVLHEAADSRTMLDSVWSVMHRGGLLVVVVPNRYSVHRILGVHLGIQDSIDSASPTEELMEQSTAYSRESLHELLSTSGFVEHSSFTHFLKPFAHAQLHQAIQTEIITADDLDACARLGRLTDEFGSEIISVSRKVES